MILNIFKKYMIAFLAFLLSILKVKALKFCESFRFKYRLPGKDQSYET